jgi:hypothetical protein
MAHFERSPRRSLNNTQEYRVSMSGHNCRLQSKQYRLPKLRANSGIFLADPHGDPAYSWIKNTARSVDELQDYSRWRREAKPETRAARAGGFGAESPGDATRCGDWNGT